MGVLPSISIVHLFSSSSNIQCGKIRTISLKFQGREMDNAVFLHGELFQ